MRKSKMYIPSADDMAREGGVIPSKRLDWETSSSSWRGWAKDSDPALLRIDPTEEASEAPTVSPGGGEGRGGVEGVGFSNRLRCPLQGVDDVR